MALLALGLAVLFALYAAIVLRTNRMAVERRAPLDIERTGELPLAATKLDVLSWNVGYAAIGRDAVFLEKLGRLVWPASRDTVRRNLAGIKRSLADIHANVYAVQEVVVTSPLSWWINVWREVSSAITASDRVLTLDVTTRLVPPPLVLAHGAGTIANVRIDQAEKVPLPLEPDYWLGCLRKHYTLLVSKLPIAGSERSWVVINVHLAAHDHAAATRREQLAAALAFAGNEYAKGNYVILAGDWNLVLGGPPPHHTTEARYLDWVNPFPRGVLPEAWQLVFDAGVPTVRTSEKPFRPGENFTAIIDGFIISPNVTVDRVGAIDLGFEHSDHNPVLGTFLARQ